MDKKGGTEVGCGTAALLVLFAAMVAGALSVDTKEERKKKNDAYLKEQKEQEDRRIKMTALKACEKEIISNSKFPSKADVHYLVDSDVRKRPGKIPGKWSLTVKGGAELMNGIGNMIPHRYHCEVLDGQVIRLEIAPG